MLAHAIGELYEGSSNFVRKSIDKIKLIVDQIPFSENAVEIVEFEVVKFVNSVILQHRFLH